MTGEQLDTELLRTFSPLDGLKRENLAALARKVQIRELSPRQFLFKEGDTEKRTMYVVSSRTYLRWQGRGNHKGWHRRRPQSRRRSFSAPCCRARARPRSIHIH